MENMADVWLGGTQQYTPICLLDSYPEPQLTPWMDAGCRLQTPGPRNGLFWPGDRVQLGLHP